MGPTLDYETDVLTGKQRKFVTCEYPKTFFMDAANRFLDTITSNQIPLVFVLASGLMKHSLEFLVLVFAFHCVSKFDHHFVGRGFLCFAMKDVFGLPI